MQIVMSLYAYAVLREWNHRSEKKKDWTGAGLKQVKGLYIEAVLKEAEDVGSRGSCSFFLLVFC